jgi:tetratricopeptide (TPR) repeat protein
MMLEAASELRGHGRGSNARAMAGRCVAGILGLPDEKRGTAERQDLALALLAAERWAEAIPLLERLETEEPRAALRWKGLRALAAYRRGDPATASRIDAEMKDLRKPYVYGENHVHRAALAAARGEKAEALDLLRQALAAGYLADNAGASFWAHRAVELAPLLGDPSFEELIKPKE